MHMAVDGLVNRKFGITCSPDKVMHAIIKTLVDSVTLFCHAEMPSQYVLPDTTFI